MTCKDRIIKDCILIGEARERGFDWTMDFAILWEPNSAYAVGVCVRPSTSEGQTGLEYISSGGQSDGDTEPAWPTTIGGVVVDGSTTWTAQALSVASLREQIDVVTWTAADDFTVADETEFDEPGRQETSARIGCDIAIDVARDNRVEVLTTEGNTVVGIFRMKVE